VQHFLEKFQQERSATLSAEHAAGPNAGGAERGAKPMTERLTFSQEAMRRLMAYQWPGNVRQLENAIERAVAFTAGRSRIDVGDLPVELQQPHEALPSSAVALPDGGLDLGAFVADIERQLIQRSLERTGGNKGHAARLLNLKRTTLVEKLKRLDRFPNP
jgi:DNA-binding NtrC family response regulator